MEPVVRFCTSADGTRIGYVLWEGGRLPCISVPGWGSSAEHAARRADTRSINEFYAAGRAMAEYDRRGVGLSERDPKSLSLDVEVTDVTAVADHARFERFDLVGFHDGTFVVAAYAAAFPERVRRLALVGPALRGGLYAAGAQGETLKHLVMRDWSMARRVIASAIAPDGPSEFQRWVSGFLRESVSPEMFVRFLEYVGEVDIAPILPHVRTPTLVLSVDRDPGVVSNGAKEVAALLPAAELAVLPARFPISTNRELGRAVTGFLDQSEEAAGLSWAASDASDVPQAMVAVLVADIADSTALTERLGDAAFREKARGLDDALRRAIRGNGGMAIEGKLLGDGVLATFGAAREAIAGATAMHEAARSADLALHVGIHAGDVIREKDNVYGGAVNIASRISALSAPGEVLVSRTIAELARTSAGVSFEDRGDYELKGIDGPVRVYAVRAG